MGGSQAGTSQSEHGHEGFVWAVEVPVLSVVLAQVV